MRSRCSARPRRIKPGARAALETKALQLVGEPPSAARRRAAGRSVYGWLIAEGKADIFLTYCTNAVAAQRRIPASRSCALPDALAVGADYGLTVMAARRPTRIGFALFILSAPGQRILARHGFAAPNLPEQRTQP